MDYISFAKNYFFLSYMRIPAFFFGVIIGYYYCENKLKEEKGVDKNPLNKIFSGKKRNLCYGLGLGLILMMIMLP